MLDRPNNLIRQKVVVELVVSNVRNGGCGKDILNLLMPWLVLKDANCGINVDLLCAIIASQLVVVTYLFGGFCS
ncbi:hypothetical protein HanXRQr2_Chr02g0066601 [Helianthus annuus]|uniref:Uncharacterized protein n=1 Tax=Helianthus annuus TaxID=4232 RepID=A0A9K3JMY7_HELAN|nr:hypothetical protein HanXRQr2_Chr02g0066601 [Helianthus annuus]KAJ0951874.1 hypothetical protein HanPSC8_Chr02g0065501 [Helianthus annuus]